MLIGVCGWLAAQILPAYRGEIVGSSDYDGWTLTATGWADGMFVFSSQPLVLVGWSANLWLAATLIARLTRHRRTALGFSLMAAATAPVGVWALATEVTYLTVEALYVAPWIWLGSILLVSAGAALWALEY